MNLGETHLYIGSRVMLRKIFVRINSRRSKRAGFEFAHASTVMHFRVADRTQLEEKGNEIRRCAITVLRSDKLCRHRHSFRRRTRLEVMRMLAIYLGLRLEETRVRLRLMNGILLRYGRSEERGVAPRGDVESPLALCEQWSVTRAWSQSAD